MSFLGTPNHENPVPGMPGDPIPGIPAWKAGRLEGRKAGRPEVWKAGRLEGWKVRGSQPGEDSRCHFDDFSGFRGPRAPETDSDLRGTKAG